MTMPETERKPIQPPKQTSSRAPRLSKPLSLSILVSRSKTQKAKSLRKRENRTCRGRESVSFQENRGKGPIYRSGVRGWV